MGSTSNVVVGGSSQTISGSPGDIVVVNSQGQAVGSSAADVRVKSIEASDEVATTRIDTDRVVFSVDGNDTAVEKVHADALINANNPSAENPIATMADATGLPADTIAACVGTTGTPSADNKFVTETDPEQTNARPPVAHGEGNHLDFLGTDDQVRCSPLSFGGLFAGTPTPNGSLRDVLQIADRLGNSVNDGRLFVDPYYCLSATTANWQLNGASKGISFRFVPIEDRAISSISFDVGALGTNPSTLTVAIYDMTTGTNYACGTTADITGTGWFRHTFAAVQCYRGRQYSVRLTWASGDVSIKYGRNDGTAAGCFPDNCSGFTTTDNWTTPAALLMSTYYPALPFIIANSLETSHVPALGLGRWNGRYVYIPDSGLVEIPEGGVFLDCSALTAATLYHVYAYVTGGVLTLEASETGTVLSDGIEVQSGATTKRYVGQVRPINLISTYQAPVDVRNARLVKQGNPANRILRPFGMDNPYAGSTSYTINANTSLRALGGNTVWQVQGLFDADSIVTLSLYLYGTGGTYDYYLTFGIDGTTQVLGSGVPCFGASTVVASGLSASFMPGAGYHTIVPLEGTTSAARTIYLAGGYGAAGTIRTSLNGTMMC